ncbi:MAG: hypothetical protein ACTSW1_14000 [Candidatus Hodarchaeales archaeon]
MKELIKYLVLMGYLNLSEALVLQNVVKNPTKISKVKKILEASSFDLNEVLESLEEKNLIVTKEKNIQANWQTIQAMLNDIKVELASISEEIRDIFVKNKLAIDPSKLLITPKDILLVYDSNKNKLPESRILREFDERARLHVIELINRMIVQGLLKEYLRLRTRSIGLTSDAAGLRYLFTIDTFTQNNVLFLEELLLARYRRSIDFFLEVLNSEKENNPIDPLILIILRNLGIIEQSKDGGSFDVLQEKIVKSKYSFEEIDSFIESVSGFIPVTLERLTGVIRILSYLDNPKEIAEELGLSPVTIVGILKMLLKFGIAERLGSLYALTDLGIDLSLLDKSDFKKRLSEKLSNYPIFKVVQEIVEQEGSIGYVDLTGRLRATGVKNFNFAKAVAVLRLLSELDMGVYKAEGSSGIYARG